VEGAGGLGGLSDDVERSDEGGAAERRPAGPRERRSLGWRRGLGSNSRVIGAGVVVAVVAGVVWVGVRGDGEPELSPAQVVSGFFQAQRDGDCERLVDLVSEASWSDGGERSRDEFLEHCDAALDGYQPAVDRLDVHEVDGAGDRLTVVWPGFSPDGVDLGEERAEGTLVREEGSWRVRLDDLVLHLGRSVDETVRGYLDAYNRADCDRLVGFLSGSVRSVDATTSAAFGRHCEHGSGDRQGARRPRPLEATGIEVSVEGDRAQATFSVTVAGGTIGRSAVEAETVQLVKEGLQWKLAGSEDLPDDWAGAPMRGVVYAELEARVVDEVVTDTACSRYLDDTADGGAGGVFGITRSFSSCYAEVSVYQFTGDELARQAVQRMADAVIDDPLPTARDLDASEAEHTIGRDRSLAEWQDYVDTLRQNHAAEVPGLPDASGVRSWCDVEGCSAASAFVARGPLAVAVRMEAGDLDDAAGILSAQLERL
jgi:hypothetical protein